MPRDKKPKQEDSGGSWLTTYGDMMTLLLCFFVLLYSFSSIDAEKFQMMMEGLQGKLGVLTGGKTIVKGSLIDTGFDAQNPSFKEFDNLQGRISNYIEQEGLAEDISLEITDRGLTIHFTGKVLFDLGQAEIKGSAHQILNKMSSFIEGLDNEIVVEGHTDNWPISNSKYPSNWELSTTRATNVIRYFIEKNGIDPVRLSAAGYSKYKPLVDNDTEDHRARNRRVDLIILKLDEEEGMNDE
ncbi:chemotaxis protein MotB [Orenia metallireducens]|uniref:Chemotaxis protein MotB n=1 Tax=Orenia metallireducens TaxID=1413210 RepID=A0A285FP69_9FIRM|nr:flagellar motor protein MotB [Orenia metallireducens]PRX33666.1 chemotaxis protein MotB [Orenia metallireducens]SNY13059.1 chemotaxis protein MotB [Orenia metallireducens]